jgi:tetratricopeptide (TPR) repeat protein
LIDVLKQEGHLSEAIDACQEAVPLWEKLVAESNDDNDRRSLADCLDRLGDLLGEAERRQEAEDSYARATAVRQRLVSESNLLNDRVSLALSHEHRGCLLRTAGRLREAEKCYREALSIWEKLVKDAHRPDDLLHFYSTWKSLDLFLAELAERVKEDGSLPEADRTAAVRACAAAAVKLRGSVQGALDEALPAARKAIESESGVAKAQYKLGDFLETIGRYEEAIAAYRQAIALKPDYTAAHNNLGNALGAQGRLEEALAEYRKALAIDPKAGAPLWNLSRLLANGPDPKRRDPRQAVELAKRGIKLEGHAGWWQTLSWAHYRTGDWNQCIAAMEKSVELNRAGALADSRAELGNQGLFLAMAHWRLGHREEARRWYDRAVEWIEKNRVELDKDRQKGLDVQDDVRNTRAEAAALMGIMAGQ